MGKSSTRKSGLTQAILGNEDEFLTTVLNVGKGCDRVNTGSSIEGFTLRNIELIT